MKTNTTPHANHAVDTQKSLSVKTNLRAGLTAGFRRPAPIGGADGSGTESSHTG
ncbi:MAG: hypothetical protein U0325_06110 [Polyangiales bacterium]